MRSSRKVPSSTRVKRTSSSSGAARSGGGIGDDWWKGLLSSPITPVLIGLAVVLAVGYWVMGDDLAASGEKTEETDKGGSAGGDGSGGTGSGSTGGTGTDSAGSGTSTGGTGTGSAGSGTDTGGTGTGSAGSGNNTGSTGSNNGAGSGSPSAADQAVVAARARIDRSGGAAKSMLVTVYYSDGLKNGESLQPVEMKVEHSVGRIKLTTEQILNPPQDLKLHSNVPKGTTILGVNFKNGVAIVDLSPEAANVKGTAAATNMIASFVYSLTDIPDVESVQLWINGQPASLHGIDWSEPLSRADVESRNWFKVEPAIEYSGS